MVYALELFKRETGFCLSCLLLLLSGDIESNPGPGKDDVLATVLATVQRIEAGQASIQDALQTLKQW